MEAVVVLGRQPEDSQSTTNILGGLILVTVSQEFRHGEVSSFDPYLGRLGDCLENHETAIGAADDDSRVIGTIHRSNTVFEFPVKELVESLCSIY